MFLGPWAKSPALAGLSDLHKIIREGLQGPFQNVTSSLGRVTALAPTIPFGSEGLAVYVGVASYQRWSEVSMRFPSSRQRIETLGSSSFEAIVKNPEFYLCLYGHKRIP